MNDDFISRGLILNTELTLLRRAIKAIRRKRKTVGFTLPWWQQSKR